MTVLAACAEENPGDAYLAALQAGGKYTGRPVVSVTRTFFERVGAAGWAAMSVDEQCALPAKYRRTVGWLIASGRVTVTPEYLVRMPAYLGGIASWVHPELFTTFVQMAAHLGRDEKSCVMQWSALAKAAGIHGVAPDQVSTDQLVEARDRLLDALAALPTNTHARQQALGRDFFRAGTTAFHAGWTERLVARRSHNRLEERESQWDAVPVRLGRTLQDYVEQVRLSLRPSTVDSIERALREFATFISTVDPDVACVADLRRRHVEAFKLHLGRRPSATGGTLNRVTIAGHLGALRTCFERLSEWDGGDVPRGVLVFAGDFPIRDERLPRFIDDAAASKLLVAARAHPDLFTRLSVEFLARTGLRRGEFLALTVDSVVRIGSSFWLRVPFGKLHNDRYLPLHPQLKELLDEWLAERPAEMRSNYPVRAQRAPDRRRHTGDGACRRRRGGGDRPGHAPPAPSHPCHPGHQPGHVARGDRRAPRASLHAHDDGLCPDRRPHGRRRVLRRQREGRGALQRPHAAAGLRGRRRDGEAPP
jgi:integrase